MAGDRVAGMKVRISPDGPTGLTGASTTSERSAAYALVANYVEAAKCIVTGLPSFDIKWQMGTDPATVCANNEILKKFKIRPEVSDGVISMLFDKGDPLIVLCEALRESPTDTATLEVTGSNGTDKVWATIQVTGTNEDPSEVDGKVKFMVSIVFEDVPVRN